MRETFDTRSSGDVGHDRVKLRQLLQHARLLITRWLSSSSSSSSAWACRRTAGIFSTTDRRDRHSCRGDYELTKYKTVCAFQLCICKFAKGRVPPTLIKIQTSQFTAPCEHWIWLYEFVNFSLRVLKMRIGTSRIFLNFFTLLKYYMTFCGDPRCCFGTHRCETFWCDFCLEPSKLCLSLQNGSVF